MERRSFVQIVAGAALACGLGGLTAAERWHLLTGRDEATGPKLVEGLRVEPDEAGFALYQDGRLALRVNEPGSRLLALANGANPFENIMARSDLGTPEDIARFFVKLGEAGYLEREVQVAFVEARY